MTPGPSDVSSSRPSVAPRSAPGAAFSRGWARHRFHRGLHILANVNCKATKIGVSFTWEGAWEYDQMSGSGRVTLGKDGRLKGTFRIKDGDSSTFIAVRAEEPDEPIPPPPSYRDKWRRRW